MTAVLSARSMTESAIRPNTSSFQQWWVLTARTLVPALRSADMPTQAVASALFTAQFYLPLKNFMGPFIGGMSSYAQFLMAAIAIQAIAFAAVSAALRSALDSVQGINRRFKALPVGRLIPLASRMTASMCRITVALTVAIICGHIIGFQFYGGILHTVGFVLFALLMGAVLALLGDLIGAWNQNPEATMPIMLVPQLIFGLLSTSIQPVDRFPEWIQPFIRNNPTTHFANTLRALGGDSTTAAPAVSWEVVGPGLAWAFGLIAVLLPLHFYVASKRK